MRRNYFLSKTAFTLVEVLMVITLMSILTVTSILSLDAMAEDAAFDKTYGKMLQIKTALIGDLDTNKLGVREYFGYLGDIGQLPTQDQGLQALLSRPAGVASWSINSTSRTGMGWRGPYLKATTGVNWLEDAWGNPFVYNAAARTLTSYGSDGVAAGTGTATDIQISFPEENIFSDLYGVINRNGVIYNGTAEVSFYQPNGSGSLRTRTYSVAAGTNGAYNFTDVPMGLRSIYVTFPALDDVIGPVLLSVDKSKFQVPHNFMDSSPGEMPHTCADVDNFSLKDGSVSVSTTNQRVYFEIDVNQSMSLASVYVRSSNESSFVRIRVGNDVRDCGATMRCYRRTLLIFATDSSTYNQSLYYPEVALESEWEIGISDTVGGFIEFSSGVDTMEWVQLRLGCKMVTLEI